jgi:penicillin-binding protein 1A
MDKLPSTQILIKFRRIFLQDRKWCSKFVKGIWISLLVSSIGIPCYIFLVVKNPYNLFGGMPSLSAIENPENELSSELISADGASLGRYVRFNRSQLRYEDLSPALVKTLIISEDHRFLGHSGMDFWSYLRVGFGLVTFNLQGGGSTLTQQTAKNLFKTRGDELQGKLASLGTPVELLISKTKEWIIAIRLEKNFTKEEIITLYLNTVPFSNNTYGIKIAAETYFNKSVKALNLQEIAVLVALLQSNYAFDPVNFPDRSFGKRNDVLRKLFVHGYIKTEAEYDSISSIPLNLNFKILNHNQGLATYFRTVLQKELLNWARENGYDLFESGLKIYTTIDSRMQYLAEKAMVNNMKQVQHDFDEQWGESNPWIDDSGTEIKNFVEGKLRRMDFYRKLEKKYGKDSSELERIVGTKRRMRVFTWEGEKDTLFSTLDSLRYYNRFLHTGLMAMNPNTGEIKAWVGGISHKYFKFDHVYQSKRQPGSTFKPFVYGKAMEDGFSPCDIYNDISPAINIDGRIYQPANANGKYGEGKPYTLRQAMARSFNSVTMQLMAKLKPKNVADFATRLGITSTLDPVYSLGLGTSDVSLYEMVAAYSGFVNEGIYTQPYYITRIEDKYGNVLESFTPKSRQVINPVTARKMLYMLKGGVEEEGGTSNALSDRVLFQNDVGGKTGTTDNASDAWYIGVTHNLVTGIWVGGDERSIHFRTWASGSGGKTALPLWNSFMESIYDHPETGYKKGFFKNHQDPIEECPDDPTY